MPTHDYTPSSVVTPVLPVANAYFDPLTLGTGTYGFDTQANATALGNQVIALTAALVGTKELIATV